MKRRKVVMRIMKCLVCQKETVVSKNAGRSTGCGHIKTMWCYNCKKITDFQQIDIK